MTLTSSWIGRIGLTSASAMLLVTLTWGRGT